MWSLSHLRPSHVTSLTVLLTKPLQVSSAAPSRWIFRIQDKDWIWLGTTGQNTVATHNHDVTTPRGPSYTGKSSGLSISLSHYSTHLEDPSTDDLIYYHMDEGMYYPPVRPAFFRI